MDSSSIQHPRRVRTYHPLGRLVVIMGAPGDNADQGFEITVRGAAGPTVRASLDDVEVDIVGETTIVRDSQADQAALFRLLQRLQEMGIEIIDVRRIGGRP